MEVGTLRPLTVADLKEMTGCRGSVIVRMRPHAHLMDI